MATPVPLKLTVCGEPGALSTMVSVPVTVPAPAGAKVTVMAQTDPPARVAGQVLICEKLPLTLIPPTCSAALPLLVRVTVSVALNPTGTFRLRLMLESATAGACDRIEMVFETGETT